MGTKVDDHRGAFVLSYPMENGIVNNWDDMERLWDHIYAKENLNVKSEEHVVRMLQYNDTTYFVMTNLVCDYWYLHSFSLWLLGAVD